MTVNEQTGDQMNTQDKISYLMQVYDRQHYFIDRHDGMAEKFINILLVEATCFSIMYTLLVGVKGTDTDSGIMWYHIIPMLLFLFAFIYTLIYLLLTVRPLSRIAKRRSTEELAPKTMKSWVKDSLIYYQGINKISERADKEQAVGEQAYLQHISPQEIEEDLARQIMILAKYPEYKKDRLEAAVRWIIATSTLGLLSILLLLLL